MELERFWIWKIPLWCHIYKPDLDFIKHQVDVRKHRKSIIQNIFEDNLQECADDMHWMNDVEFKRKYRCSHPVLDKIVQKIETNDVFKRGTRGPAQMSMKHQLMLLLHFLGKEGESNASQQNQFKVSYGASEKCQDRVVQSLIDIRDEYIKWLTENESKQIAQRIEREFLLPNCIVLMDGTLLPMGIAPSCNDAADYSGRKSPYSLTACVINDDKWKIRAYLSGFPGSTHDNRVWRNMIQNQEAGNFFSPLEYVLCDTAFEPSDIAIAA
jgi:hypothetical protein